MVSCNDVMTFLNNTNLKDEKLKDGSLGRANNIFSPLEKIIKPKKVVD